MAIWKWPKPNDFRLVSIQRRDHSVNEFPGVPLVGMRIAGFRQSVLWPGESR
jgi:hypothetical protein